MSAWTGKLTEIELQVNNLGVGIYVPGIALPFIESREKVAAGPFNQQGTSPPPLQSEPVREKIIERQVMVIRCKFCGHITPADLNNCTKCGAAAFC